MPDADESQTLASFGAVFARIPFFRSFLDSYFFLKFVFKVGRSKSTFGQGFASTRRAQIPGAPERRNGKDKTGLVDFLWARYKIDIGISFSTD